MTYYEKNTDTIILKDSNRADLHFIGWCDGYIAGSTYEEVADKLRKRAWAYWNTFEKKGILCGRNLYRKPTKEEYARRKEDHEKREARAINTIIEIEAR